MFSLPATNGRSAQTWQLHLFPLVIWTIAWGFFFATLLWGKERLPHSDFSGQFHAWAVFQAREMGQGRLPLWSPGSQGGFPFAADPQSAVFYPPRWLTILGFTIYDLRFTIGELPFYALELEGLLHIWLAGVFAYLLAYDITKEQPAALITAVAFGLGGYLTSYPLLQLAILETITWLPLGLFFIRRGTANTYPQTRYLLAAGITFNLSALAGHPQTLLHIAYMAMAYYLFRVMQAGWSWRQIANQGIQLGLVVVGISAVSWLPAAQYLLYTTRNHVTYEFVSAGEPMLNYLQLVIPGTLALWSPEYVGLPALVLALSAWCGHKNQPELTREILFWGMTAVCAAWVALGDAGILFEAVYHLPGFSLFRQQERLVGLVSLSLAILAGLGWVAWQPRLAWKLPSLVLGGLVGAALIFTAGPHLVGHSWQMWWGRQLIVLVITGLLIVAIKRWAADRPLALLLLVALMVFDLYTATLTGLNRQPGSPTVYWPQPEWVKQLRAETAESPFRITSRGLFHANLGEIYGLEDIDGISPLKPRFLEQFQKLPQARRWQLLGVRYILDTHPPEAPATPIASFDGGMIPERNPAFTLYRFETALPRAWMSYQPVVVDSPEMARERIADTAFDPATQVVLTAPLVESLSLPERPPMVQINRVMAHALQVWVETAVPGILVISEWNYPGWQAALDGQPVPIFSANYALQGVWVPAGTHEVLLQFRPLDVKVGVGISAIFLLLALWQILRK